MTWKVSVFSAISALMLKQPNQCLAFPDFFQIMVVFPAPPAFPVCGHPNQDKLCPKLKIY